LLKTHKNKKKNKFIVSERQYIGITATINAFRSTLASCEAGDMTTATGGTTTTMARGSRATGGTTMVTGGTTTATGGTTTGSTTTARGRKRQQYHHHQRTNGSTIVNTFTSPDNFDLFKLIYSI
jgi:hypothetical protein